MFETWLTRELGIKYPIIQGAMMWLARAELASAVSNAGGLGNITAGIFPTGKEFRNEIRKMRGLTDKPFTINISLFPARRPINYEEYINIAIEEGVKIIETAGRSPEAYMKLFKEGKVKHLHKVARIRDAATAERLGADAVTIVGFEAGGHPGMEDVTSLIRLPRAVDSLKIPVIAAGGFYDGRGLVAALAFGAQGIQMGTRFMVSQESPLHPGLKESMVKSTETDTMMVMRSINNAARILKTDYALKIAELESKGTTLEELLNWAVGTKTRECFEKGTTEGMIFCGQVIGSIKEVASVKEIIDGIITEARTIAASLSA